MTHDHPPESSLPNDGANAGKTSAAPPAISVIVTLYNKGPWIQRAVDSVLAQTFQDFEIIVVDDGSTDDGPDIVRRMTDPRIRLIRQENQGVSAARNHGIDAARADLIAFQDGDDEWFPDYLKTMYDMSRRLPDAALWSCMLYVIRDDGTYYEPVPQNTPMKFDGAYLPDYFLTRQGPSVVGTTTSLIRKSVFDTVGQFKVGEVRMQDLHMWARIALEFPIAFCPRRLAVYYKGSTNNATTRHIVTWKTAYADTMENALREKNFKRTSSYALRYALAYHYIEIARNCADLGKYADARRFLLKIPFAPRMYKRIAKLWLRAWRPLDYLYQRFLAKDKSIAYRRKHGEQSVEDSR